MPRHDDEVTELDRAKLLVCRSANGSSLGKACPMNSCNSERD